MGTGYFSGVKQPGRGADHPPPPSAEVKKEESYNSIPPQGPWWPLYGEQNKKTDVVNVIFCFPLFNL
jgi:hypothetical protein